MGTTRSRVSISSSTYVPMWVMSVKEFLKLNHMPKHEELMRAGLLVKRSHNHFCIFVSHQWLGSRHPDPNLQQLPILQKALRNMLLGRCSPQSDLASQFFGESRRFSKRELQQLQDAYIWLDWFSIPQEASRLMDLMDAESELMDQVQTDSDDKTPQSTPDFSHFPSLRSPTSLTNQDLYISSIPFFVEDIFVALVPHFYHHDTEQKCNFRSYLTRGWCRLEMWCSILCIKADQPFLIVKGSDEVEFATSMILTDRPPHEGLFTVEDDRSTIYYVMKRALQNRISTLRRNGQWDMFRFTVARYETLLGDAAAKRTLNKFQREFAFDSLESAKKIKGIGPVECAILSCDVGMIEYLAGAGFELSRNVSANINVEILQNGRSPLDFALELCWRTPEVIEQLVKCKANVHHVDQFGFSPLGACKTVRDVELLMKYKAEVNKTSGPMHVPPLTLACVRGAPTEVVAKLIGLGAEVNPPCKGVNSPHPLANLAVWSCSNPHCLENAVLLLEAKSDIDFHVEAKGVFKAISMACRARLQLIGSDSLLVHWFAEWTTTPLGFACFYGGDEFAEFLLSKDADPNVKNARGHTPFELARGQSVLNVLENYTSIRAI